MTILLALNHLRSMGLDYGSGLVAIDKANACQNGWQGRGNLAATVHKDSAQGGKGGL